MKSSAATHCPGVRPTTGVLGARSVSIPPSEPLAYFSDNVSLDQKRHAVRLVGKPSEYGTACNHRVSARDVLKAWLTGRGAKRPERGASEKPAGSGEVGDNTLEGQDDTVDGQYETLTYFSDNVPLPQNTARGEMIYSVITICGRGGWGPTRTTYVRCLPRVRHAVTRARVVLRPRATRPCPRARRHTASRAYSRGATADGDTADGGGDGGPSPEVILVSRPYSLLEAPSLPGWQRRFLQLGRRDRDNSGPSSL